jgi:acyl-CoA synthetase (NDP forming)/RimJ/RimL family protein N-acetyltransferase
VADEPTTGPYPKRWETDVVLSDGSTAHLRPIRPDDRERLRRFHGRQSRESIYYRFFRFRPELSETELTHFTHLDYRDRMAFVAILGDEVVAVSRYERWPDRDDAEVAFFVDDAHHGKGVATIMLEYLAAAARDRGLAGFTASVLPENARMLAVFRRAGFDVSTRFADGLIEVELGIEVTEETSAAIEQRDRRAQARSVARLLRPGSVAVVGASRHPDRIGRALFDSIRAGGFTGPVYPVNPHAADVDGVPACRRVSDIGGEVDLAVVAVPRDGVLDTVRDCVASRVGGLLVVSAGFAESGPAGAARERELVEVARSGGIRLIGPNAFGLVNTDPEVSLHALFIPGVVPPTGRVALLSQSGPLGAAVLDQLRRAKVGVSTFVSVGNRADVSVNDLLQYWTVDEATDVVLLYLESYGNLRKLGAIARTLSTTKPVVAVRPHGAGDSLCRLLTQAGIILVESVGEMASMARVLSAQPLPAGNRVAIVANSASVARLAAGSARRAGLEVVVPASVAGSTDGPLLIGDADTVDFELGATASDYRRVLRAVAASDDVDAVLAAIVPTLVTPPGELADLLDEVDRAVDKPLVSAGLVHADLAPSAGVPSYVFPEDAVRPLGHLATLARWRRQELGTGRELSPNDARARRDVALGALGEADERGLDLFDDDGPALLTALGLPLAAVRVVRSLDDAAAAADELGYPVVLKAGGVVRRLVGEAGGTALDLHDPAALRAAYQRMQAVLGESAMNPVAVQRSVPSGATVMVELEQDPRRGAFIRVGIGGVMADASATSAARIIPVTDVDARALVAESTVSHLLDRGAVEPLLELVQDLSAVALAVPELALVRFNPVLAAPSGAVPVDVRVVLRPWPSDPLAGVRHL